MWRQRILGRRHLQFEQFESRRLMAVTTSLINGTLTITGDAAADDIAIVGTANPGEITVIGRNGTLVDGMPQDPMTGESRKTIAGVTAHLDANFDDGDNIINVDNVYLAGQLNLDTGDGDDRVIFGVAGVVSSAGNCMVNTGDGSDLFRAEDYKVFIADRLEINLGDKDRDIASLIGASALTSVSVSGSSRFSQGGTEFFLRGITSGGLLEVQAQAPINNVAIFTSAASGELRVYCRSGQNSIYLDTCYSGRRIVVDSWTSSTPFLPNVHPPVAAPYNINDTVTVARCQTPQLFVNTTGDALPTYFGGDDTVFLYGNNIVGPVVDDRGAHTVKVETGDGHDNVSASYNVVLGNVFVSLAQLDDILTLAGNQVSGFASADGGEGTNRLNLFGNQFGGFASSRFS